MNNRTKNKLPIPLFDVLDNINNNPIPSLTKQQFADFNQALAFLKSYTGNIGTFNSYRREIEKLLQWSWLITNKTIKELKRNDLENFIVFCQKPPKSWIGITQQPRFIEKLGLRIPNPKWRPFITTISKVEQRKGADPKQKKFSLSHGTIKECFAILSSFYNYLLQEEYVVANPVALIRQKSKFIRKQQGSTKIRRLSALQWQYVINTAKDMANTNPALHERTLFIISALYAMYLRISELVTTSRWGPLMNHFYHDYENNWWFITVGKGNKQRQIAVSQAMLAALKRWRKFLGGSALPSPADQSPLLPKIKGKGAISDPTHIRSIVQYCFDQTIVNLHKDGFNEEADSLSEATVHWLRHTGISDDVKIRPREHVRDDAGHSSSAITDQYIDIELKARHKSAKNKPIYYE